VGKFTPVFLRPLCETLNRVLPNILKIPIEKRLLIFVESILAPSSWKKPPIIMTATYFDYDFGPYDGVVLNTQHYYTEHEESLSGELRRLVSDATKFAATHGFGEIKISVDGENSFLQDEDLVDLLWTTKIELLKSKSP
jgi:hypothetical protein